jgi:predicted DCC family thiol-disulfide oxidoreductase YuxK
MTTWCVEAFYDGDCPLCVREVRLLQRLDRKRQRIRWTDIAAPDFDARSTGKTFEEFMQQMHGRLPDGTWIEGVEVFRQLYAAVGLGPLVALSRLPGIAWVADRAYEVFARNRLQWTGRCQDGVCELPRQPTRSRVGGA